MPNYFCYSNITLTLMCHFCKFDHTLHHWLCVRERVKHRTYKSKKAKNQTIRSQQYMKTYFLTLEICSSLLAAAVAHSHTNTHLLLECQLRIWLLM